MSPLFA